MRRGIHSVHEPGALPDGRRQAQGLFLLHDERLEVIEYDGLADLGESLKRVSLEQ
jgi:hypothetical protein